MSKAAAVGPFRPASTDVRAHHRLPQRSRRYAPPDRAPVVVGIDGSRESLNAAGFAVREAQLWRRPMMLLHAYGRRPRYLQGESAQVVDNVVDELKLPKNVHVETRLVDGDAAPAMLRAGPAASMLVVGRHRSGSGAHLLSGSVSSVLSSHAPCPVMVISEAWHAEQHAEGPVVVAVNADLENADLLSFAFRRAHLSGVSLRVLHPFPDAAVDQRSVRVADIVALVDQWRAQYPAVRVTTQYAHDDSAAAIAAAWTASLIVVGQPKSLTGAGSWLRSVGYAVVRHTIRPVAVIPRSHVSSARVA